MAPPTTTLTLESAAMLSHNVRWLRFVAQRPMVWQPGQFVSLKLPTEGGIARSYSIASRPCPEGFVEFAVTLVEDGPGSHFLHALPVGASLESGPPMGFFTLPEALTRPVIFVGTGTGVTPLRAMLQQVVGGGHGGLPVRLLHGVRTEADRIFADEFAALAAAHPHFAYEATLSRPSPAWSGLSGYVQTHLARLVEAVGAPCDVYVCGLSPMIKAVRSTLKDTLGFGRECIHTERFD
ncbi:MAG: FAD-dependent oxidoreductase [Myxococcales bacterium]|nr:FAD-dependent oxidoreductase [Myxococcales bacterium]